jgi:uncharacterized membrane protein (UPF0127 family)
VKRRFAGLVVLALVGAACAREETLTRPRDATQDLTSRDYHPPPYRRARLFVPDAFGGTQVLTLEVADTDALRKRGLMWRESLPEGEGMLFVFPSLGDHTFWMRNTLIPLDLLFFDEEWRLIGTLEGMEPGSLRTRGIGLPSRYVVEVPAGWVGRAGLQAGAQGPQHRPSRPARIEGL